jgi:photosystem II stability/assembly factor-like uncharacterized protein
MSVYDDQRPHQWRQSTLNGGGFIAGILQDPTNPAILYARSDVAGVFKSADGGRSWQTCNHGMTGYHQHDVRSFALNPQNPHILFRASGSMRGGTFFGAIHKSVDGGDFWVAVCHNVDFYGNGEGRQYGEVLAVSPHDENLVVAGGYTKGLWASTDGGTSWAYRALKDERIACVCFHPTQNGILYVGTLGSYDHDPVFVRQQYDYVRPHKSRLYRSQDNGMSWEVLSEGIDFGEIVFDPHDNNMLHAACLAHGVMKSSDDGYTWRNTAPNLSKYNIGTVTLDPHNPSIVYAAAETFPNFDDDVPPIGVYRSHDAGETWQLIRWHTESDLKNYPSYMSLTYAGWAIAKVRVDPRDSQTLLMSNWYGVSISRDGGHTWDANHFAGMENICIDNMTVHNGVADTLYMVPADHNPKVSTDGGRTFKAMPRPDVQKSQPDSTAIVASRHQRDVVLYGIKGSGGCSIVRCDLDGANPRVVFDIFIEPDTEPSRLALQSRAAGVSVHALVEDPFRHGTFYAYLDGILDKGAGLYATHDWGDTWQRVSRVFPARLARVPHQREWIENELLSVVIAQTKNVCGTNQLLCADPHRAGTLYVGEWTEGLFRSDDAGHTWHDISAGLPFQRQHASTLNVIRADEKRAGVLYAGFIHEGLWRSDDFGDTWQKVFPTDERIYNATSVAIGGKNGDLIVLVSEPLYHAPCVSSVMVSQDAGATWQDVYDPRLGAIRWKSVVIGTHTNRIHAGSCGNSAFYLDLDDTL